MSAKARPDYPDTSNQFLGQQAETLLRSYQHWTGRELIDPALEKQHRYRALFEAPFAVVSHDCAADPIFNYGNLTALRLFEMDWGDFTSLSSRLSAEPDNRDKRSQLLAQVSQNGFVSGYQGVRISANGRRFLIQDCTIWNLIDQTGHPAGQAACFVAS